ncbi:MAG: hypothetical protein QOG53_799 [Frankiales bacterium]|jgi:hypothetical protein|nr:hypothetical protein [Frankiales bacterium]
MTELHAPLGLVCYNATDAAIGKPTDCVDRNP